MEFENNKMKFEKIVKDITNNPNINDFVKYMYNLVNVNIGHLDLRKHNENHFFNYDEFKKILEQITNEDIKKSLALHDYIYNNVTYVSMSNIIRIIDENINYINSVYNDHTHVLIFNDDNIVHEQITTKSNFYFNLYFIYRYTLITGKIIENMYVKLSSVLYHIDNYLTPTPFLSEISNNVLFILCDDFVYSGSQLSSKQFNFSNLRLKLDNKYKIFLNIIGISYYAKERFDNFFKNNEGESPIIISDSTIKVDSALNILLKYYRLNKIDYKLDSDNFKKETQNKIRELLPKLYGNRLIHIKKFFDKINMQVYTELGSNIDNYYGSGDIYLLNNENLTLAYLDFKYPDLKSTVQSLCNFNIPRQGYYIVVSKLLTDLKLDDPSIPINNIILLDKIKERISHDDIQFILLNYDNHNAITHKFPWITYFDGIKDDSIKDKNNNILLINNTSYNPNKKCFENWNAFYKILPYKNVNVSELEPKPEPESELEPESEPISISKEFDKYADKFYQTIRDEINKDIPTLLGKLKSLFTNAFNNKSEDEINELYKLINNIGKTNHDYSKNILLLFNFLSSIFKTSINKKIKGIKEIKEIKLLNLFQNSIIYTPEIDSHLKAHKINTDVLYNINLEIPENIEEYTIVSLIDYNLQLKKITDEIYAKKLVISSEYILFTINIWDADGNLIKIPEGKQFILSNVISKSNKNLHLNGFIMADGTKENPIYNCHNICNRDTHIVINNDNTVAKLTDPKSDDAKSEDVKSEDAKSKDIKLDNIPYIVVYRINKAPGPSLSDTQSYIKYINNIINKQTSIHNPLIHLLLNTTLYDSFRNIPEPIDPDRLLLFTKQVSDNCNCDCDTYKYKYKQVLHKYLKYKNKYLKLNNKF